MGYYSDGVKRTLTNEQISMFRHSEIYALLRERQVKKENKDAGFDEVSLPASPTGDIIVATDRIAEEGMDSDGEEDEEEEYAIFLAAEQQQMQTEAARKKRKRTDHSSKMERSKEPTSRRLAREMDEAGADETVLDYGDETPEDAISKEQHLDADDLDGINSRKRVKYEKTEESPLKAAKSPAVEGRKIWWPTIGG